MFWLFCFDRQLITPKFPVVVKIGHAHQGLGKVRWLSSLLTLRLLLLSYLLSPASLSLSLSLKLYSQVCVFVWERGRDFSSGHQFSIILLIRFLLSDNTVCSSVLQVRIIAKKPPKFKNEICWYFLEPVHFTVALHAIHSGFYLLGFLFLFIYFV